MSFVGKAIGSVTGANKQAKAAQNAANIQAEAAEKASQIQKDMFEQVRSDLNPYRTAGNDALAQLMGKMQPNGFFNQTYSGQDIYDDPSYQFRVNQGTNAIQGGAAAQGGLLSGATLKALQNYGQESASQEYQNAYNRFNADQTNQYNRFYNLVGMGQNAAAQTGNAGTQTAQAIANNTMQGANSQAAGTIAAGNRTANTFNAVLNVAKAATGFMNPVM